jgi:hypothetical protein
MVQCQKHVGGAIIGGQSKKCTQVTILEQKLHVLKQLENNKKNDTVHVTGLNKVMLHTTCKNVANVNTKNINFSNTDFI